MDNVQEASITWPESCGYYSESQFCGIHECKHPMGRSCCPISCPLKKIEEMEKKVVAYRTLVTKCKNPEDVKWYTDSIEFWEKKISEYMNA